MYKLISSAVLLLCVASAAAQLPTNATGNTLVNGTTASNASVASTNSAAFKMSIQGAQINWGTGVNTVTSPTIYFRNTTASTGKIWAINSGNTGFFSISDATGTTTPLTITNRLVINPTGNVGIGVAAPDATLHLKAGTSAAGTAPLRFTATGSSLLTTAQQGAMEYNGSALFFTPGTARKEIAFTDLSNVTGPVTVAKGGTGLTTVPAGALLYASALNTVSALPIGATQGHILTVGPAGMPQWQAAAGGSGSGWNLTGNAGTTSGNFIGTTDAQDLRFRAGVGTDIKMVIQNNTGNVGIGTSNPAYLMEVSGATNATAYVRTTGTGPANMFVGNLTHSFGLQFMPAGNGAWPEGTSVLTTGSSPGNLVFHTLNPIQFFINNVERARFSLTGNFGLGTTTPSEKLDVAGNIRFSGALMPNNIAGTAGQVLTSNGAGAAPTWANPAGGGGSGWSLTGNAGTVPGTNFIGTTDDKDLVFKRGGLKSGLINLSLSNTAFGVNAMRDNTTGGSNSFFGSNAGAANTTGFQNTFIGKDAGALNTSGGFNTFTGTGAGGANNTGALNSFFGAYAGTANTTGQANNFFGYYAGAANTVGYYNNFIGMQSGLNNFDGAENNFVGFQAGFSNVSGNGNSYIGRAAGHSNVTGHNNIAIGSFALHDVASSSNNVAVGNNTGRGITTGGNNTIIGANVTGLPAALSNNIIIADGAGNRRINVDATGNIGIGTTNPLAKVHLYGENPELFLEGDANSYYTRIRIKSISNTGWIDNYGPVGGGLWLNVNSTSNKHIGLGTTPGGSMAITWDPAVVPFSVTGAQSHTGDFFKVNKNTSTTPGVIIPQTVFSINKDGNVSIGSVTTFPSGTGTNYKLAVAGDIMAEKLKVKLQNAGWPDYVFDNDYRLPSIKELEAFIQKNKHLPNVPSAEQIKKDGIDVGDNQRILLEKIEELTLYIIEQNKKIELLEADRQKIKEQEQQLVEIKKLLTATKQ